VLMIFRDIFGSFLFSIYFFLFTHNKLIKTDGHCARFFSENGVEHTHLSQEF